MGKVLKSLQNNQLNKTRRFKMVNFWNGSLNEEGEAEEVEEDFNEDEE